MMIMSTASWRVLLALVTFLPHSAQGVLRVDPDGQGQVLLFPYYTVNAGQQTLISISNSTDTPKALKLRLRDASRGAVLLSMNIYLSSRDTWTAAIFATADSQPASLTSTDDSCTVPSFHADALQPLPQLPGGSRVLQVQAPLVVGGVELTREGYVEVFEMGTLLRGSQTELATQLRPGGRDCRSLEHAWQPDGRLTANPALDVLDPSGDLYGREYLVTAATGTAVSLRPVALAGFSVQPQHSPPTAATPNLGTARTTRDVARFITTVAQTSEGPVTSTWDRSLDAVSAVLLKSRLWGEINLDPVLGANSEWILTDPLRSCEGDPACLGSSVMNPGCHQLQTTIDDREGQRSQASGIPEQEVPVQMSICNATQIWAWAQTGRGPSSLLKSLFTQRWAVPDGYRAGQASVRLGSAGGVYLSSREGHNYFGVPLITQAFEGFSNRGVNTGLSGLFLEAAPLSGRLHCSQLVGGDQVTNCFND